MSGLRGLSVLIVEDELLLGLDLAAILRHAGCRVSAICVSEETALASIRDSRPDAAVLDVNIAGQMAFPVADALAASRIPFVWVTGYARDMLPEVHRDRPFVGKPFTAKVVVRELARAVAAARPR